MEWNQPTSSRWMIVVQTTSSHAEEEPNWFARCSCATADPTAPKPTTRRTVRPLWPVSTPQAKRLRLLRPTTSPPATEHPPFPIRPLQQSNQSNSRTRLLFMTLFSLYFIFTLFFLKFSFSRSITNFFFFWIFNNSWDWEWPVFEWKVNCVMSVIHVCPLPRSLLFPLTNALVVALVVARFGFSWNDFLLYVATKTPVLPLAITGSSIPSQSSDTPIKNRSIRFWLSTERWESLKSTKWLRWCLTTINRSAWQMISTGR